MTSLPVTPNLHPDRFPLPPQETASLECLLHRLHPIHELLLKRRFSDAVVSRAVDAALNAGIRALASGKAAKMSSAYRAGWLWKVALNAARKAAATEPRFVPLQGEDVDRRMESGEDEGVFDALRRAMDQLPSHQQQAFELHFLQGQSFRKAAQFIGVGSGTVVYRYQRGLRRLAVEMNDVFQERSARISQQL